MIRSSVCAYPWDLVDDPAAADRFAAFGADTVSLAASYHAVRAATPRHGGRRIVDAPHSALYVPVDATVWRGRRLRPAPADAWTGDADSFGTAMASLTDAGLRTSAWTALTHHDSPAEGIEDLLVHTAFGDALSYALCPSADEVVEYAETVVAGVAATGVAEMMLESVGPLGVDHGSAHDKIAGADWSPVDIALLSVCCCPACGHALREYGADPDAVAARIRAAIGAGAASVDDALGEFAEPVLAVRRAATGRLLDAATATARRGGVSRVSVHAGVDRWATSSFATLSDDPTGLDAVVLSDATAHRLGTEELAQLTATTGAAVSAYVSAMPPLEPTALSAHWGQLVEKGVEELVIYHGGLLSEARASAAAAALADAKLIGRSEA